MVVYIKDKDNNLKIIKNKKEIIIDPMEKPEVKVLIKKEKEKLYETLLKYYEIIINEYYRFYLKKQEKKETIETVYYKMLNTPIKPTQVSFYSDNSVPQFANIFTIEKTLDSISLNTYTRNDELLGNFILLTSQDNYGKYGQFFDILSEMIDSIDEIQKGNEKVKKLVL